MIKVLIVDDEPFIRQGLGILIDWNKYGYEIVGEAQNGIEAIKLIEDVEVDLIITDIKMPEMNGLELIEYVSNKYSNKIKFVVLSGFYEFEYAKKAIKFGVKDYVLKPIQKDELNNVLKDLQKEFDKLKNEEILKNQSKKIEYDNSINKILFGKEDNSIINKISSQLNFSKYMRFILLEINYDTNKNKEEIKKRCYEMLKDYVKNDYNIIFNINDKINSDCIGIIFDYKLISSKVLDETSYILNLEMFLNNKCEDDIYMYIGNKVFQIKDLKKSYEEATILKLSRTDKKVIYYEDIYKEDYNSHIIKKEYIDYLVKAIEENDNKKIIDSINSFYNSFQNKFIDIEMIKINIDYLLVNLINIEKDLTNEENKKQLLEFVELLDLENIVSRNSSKNLIDFSLRFADYLSSLRKNSSLGILSYIDKEIYENYMKKLSLKSLSEKYYLNSAYLGQIFKKKYKVSFKDYLNEYRIEKAAELLKRSDEKIYRIAESVGYSNPDYFINKFMQIKGKTPYQYRKQFFNNDN